MGIASPWTTEICQFLEANWLKASASKLVGMIASQFRVDVTRNAVVGRAHRMGLDAKPNGLIAGNDTNRAQLIRERQRMYNQRHRDRRAQETAFNPKTVAQKISLAPVSRSEPLRLPLLDLEDSMCRYECSGADQPRDFLFCAHKTLPGTSYCAAHCRRVFIQTNRQRAQA